MKVRPLHDRILLKRIEEKESVKGGIIIPDTAKEKPQEGVVVAVGNGKILENGTRITLEVKAGDHVLFGKYSGTDIKIEGEEYLIIREGGVSQIKSFKIVFLHKNARKNLTTKSGGFKWQSRLFKGSSRVRPF
jgi:chaperonin GroES